VRTAAEFARGHIDGARNVPLQELEKELASLEPRDRPVVVYCASGVRSRAAKATLGRAGFTAVHDLGPMTRWR
jgi:rhodanese-related sulfurtransferase